MPDQDCYFFIDESVPEEERTISVLCVECHDKKLRVGSFYPGSKEGYGPFDFQCHLCKNYVHKAENGEEDETTS